MDTATKVPKSYKVRDSCLNCGNASFPTMIDVPNMVCGFLKDRPKKRYTNSDQELYAEEYPRLVSFAGFCDRWRKR
jgi:hypothetical protein